MADVTSNTQTTWLFKQNVTWMSNWRSFLNFFSRHSYFTSHHSKLIFYDKIVANTQKLYKIDLILKQIDKLININTNSVWKWH